MRAVSRVAANSHARLETDCVIFKVEEYSKTCARMKILYAD